MAKQFSSIERREYFCFFFLFNNSFLFRTLVATNNKVYGYFDKDKQWNAIAR